jgi:hypothetical protein
MRLTDLIVSLSQAHIQPIFTESTMLRLPFQTTLLLAPLAYALHHAEEHLLFNFREWRLRYFPDNNMLSTEAVFVILTAVTLIYLLLFNTLRTRISAWMVLLFLMATQVQNALFHLGGTLAFRDFSPGLLTGLLLYLPVNMLIMRAALREGLVTSWQLLLLFVGGGLLFWGFEFFGPLTLLLATLTCWGWTLVDARNAAVPGSTK